MKLICKTALILIIILIFISSGSETETTANNIPEPEAPAPSPDGNEPDYERTVCFINGGTEKHGTKKISYKSCEWIITLTPSAIISNSSDGKCKAKNGKIIAAVTADKTKPVVINGRVEKDKEALNIAKAVIKNGKITVSAGKQNGMVYVWALDTGDEGAYLCKEFYVETAPSKIEAYLDENCTIKYAPQKIPLGETIKIYIKSSSKDGTLTSYSYDIYTGETAGPAKGCFDISLEGDYNDFSNKPYDAVLTVKANSLNPKKDGKSYKENIQIIEHLSNKKIKLSVTAINPLKDIDICSKEGISLFASGNSQADGDTGASPNDSEKIITLTVKRGGPLAAEFIFYEITCGECNTTAKTRMMVCDSLSDVEIKESSGAVTARKASGGAKNIKVSLKNHKLLFSAKSGKISSEFDFYLIFATEKGYGYKQVKVSVKFAEEENDKNE